MFPEWLQIFYEFWIPLWGTLILGTVLVRWFLLSLFNYQEYEGTEKKEGVK